MANLNRVLLIGRISNELELKKTTNGTSVLNFSLAVNKIYKVNGEKKEEVSFINVQCFSELAESINKYSEKGKLIFVEGALEQQRWEKDGKKQSRLIVSAQRIQFLEFKQSDMQKQNSNDDRRF